MTAREQARIELESPSRNNVAVIAALAPATIGWLSVPLTPARAAALAAFTARTGVSAQALAADLIDDIVFARPVSEKS
jgi:hypothetical protein